MKKILPLILLYLTSMSMSSQVTTEINNRPTLVGGRYVIMETKTFEKDKYGLDIDVTIEKDDFVEIIAEEGENVTFILVKTKEIKNAILNGLVSVDDISAFQTLPKFLFFYYAKQQFQRFKGVSAGVYTIPYKLRIASNCDFESALSLQSNVAFGIGDRNSLNSIVDASFGIGVTGINLTPENSDVTENRSAMALTLSVGTIINFTKTVNLGIFLGGDFLNKSDRKTNWDYNEKLWIGIGINVAFKVAENKQKAENNKNFKAKVNAAIADSQAQKNLADKKLQDDRYKAETERIKLQNEASKRNTKQE